MSWLEEQLDTHAAPGRTGTFADLLYQDPDPQHQAEGPRQFRLVVTASDLSAGRLRHLPTDAEDFGTTPGQLRVVETVRASTSIPLFFRPVRWKNAQGQAGGAGGRRAAVELPGLGVRPAGRRDAALAHLRHQALRHGRRQISGSENRIRGPLSFGKAVVDTVTGFYDRMHIDSSHSVARTIFIDTAAVRPTQFDLSEDGAGDAVPEGAARPRPPSWTAMTSSRRGTSRRIRRDSGRAPPGGSEPRRPSALTPPSLGPGPRP